MCRHGKYIYRNADGTFRCECIGAHFFAYWCNACKSITTKRLTHTCTGVRKWALKNYRGTEVPPDNMLRVPLHTLVVASPFEEERVVIPPLAPLPPPPPATGFRRCKEEDLELSRFLREQHFPRCPKCNRDAKVWHCEA